MCISPAQVTRFWTIARNHGYTDEGAHLMLTERCGGITSAKDILKGEMYELACKLAEKPDLAAHYNKAAEREAVPA